MANKHTTAAAAVFAACVALSKIGKVWWPSHSEQLDATVAAIKDFAVMYGFTMAGDGSGKNGNGNGDTAKPDNTIMKKITLILAIAGLVFGAQAQTNTFFQSTLDYFTTFNTNLTTFQTDRVNIWADAATVDASTTRASFGACVKVYDAFDVESITRNGAVGGTVVSEQGGVGYSLVHYDTKLTIYGHAGWRFDTRQTYGCPGLRVMKALTPNTYAVVGVELPLYFRKGGGDTGVNPTFYIGTGFKF